MGNDKNKGTYVKDLPVFASPTYQYYIVTDNYQGTVTGRVSYTNAKKILNYTAVIGAPTIAGVAGTKTVDGSDVAHVVTLDTSVSPAPGATIATVTFGQAYAVAPTIVFSPANDGAMDTSLQGVQMKSNGSLTSYIIVAGPGGFTGGVECIFNVHVLI